MIRRNRIITSSINAGLVHAQTQQPKCYILQLYIIHSRGSLQFHGCRFRSNHINELCKIIFIVPSEPSIFKANGITFWFKMGISNGSMDNLQHNQPIISPYRRWYFGSNELACAQSNLFDPKYHLTLRWRHNERDSVSNHQPHDCLLNRLFRRRSK